MYFLNWIVFYNIKENYLYKLIKKFLKFNT